MTFYAVRIKEDHEAVGLFTAETLKDLWWIADQVCDPGVCQYRILINCGIVWTNPTGWCLPEIRKSDEEDDNPIFVGASMDDSLWEYLNVTDKELSDEGWKDMEPFSMKMLG